MEGYINNGHDRSCFWLGALKLGRVIVRLLVMTSIVNKLKGSGFMNEANRIVI